MSQHQVRLLILAGGTGGHIIPAMTIASLAKEQGWSCCWLGTHRGMEREWTGREGIPFVALPMEGWQGRSWRQWGRLSLLLLQSLHKSYRLIRKFRPTVVLGMGGYTTVAPALVARLLRIPLVLHEQNAVVGWANRFLGPIANLRLYGMLRGHLSPAQQVGNPIRKELVNLPNPVERFASRTGPIRVLVMGGSQGSHAINQAVLGWIAAHPDAGLLWHQTGLQECDEVQAAYRACGYRPYRVEPFSLDIASAYQWADVVIARSGAMTVSELQTVGVAALLVPYPHHKDQQQKKNAEPLCQAGGAWIVEERELNPEKLYCYSSAWSRDYLLKMAIRARSLASPQAGPHILQHLYHLQKKRS